MSVTSRLFQWFAACLGEFPATLVIAQQFWGFSGCPGNFPAVSVISWLFWCFSGCWGDFLLFQGFLAVCGDRLAFSLRVRPFRPFLGCFGDFGAICWPLSFCLVWPFAPKWPRRSHGPQRGAFGAPSAPPSYRNVSEPVRVRSGGRPDPFWVILRPSGLIPVPAGGFQGHSGRETAADRHNFASRTGYLCSVTPYYP